MKTLTRLSCLLCVDAVTCVQFNLIDNNYFISGSLDGKVWIQKISNCNVLDIKDIVTVVSYRPNGQVCYPTKF
ncbi:LOW QUALITY PROTEIN: hypothetical protein V2J09_006574 [Rumex salicifolius]